MRRSGLAAVALFFGTLSVLTMSNRAAAQGIGDFALPNLSGDLQGKPGGQWLGQSHTKEFRLSDCNAPLVAVVFLGVDCPLAKLYVPRLNEAARQYSKRGVQILAIDSNHDETPQRIAAFAADVQLAFPLLADSRHHVADMFGATRSPEAFVLDAARVVRYRGRIDDQLLPGANRGQPTRRDLVVAIDELLAGNPVSIPVTEAKGCVIDRGDSAEQGEATEVTYGEQIAPIFERHCLECHRPGQIAPFSLTTYNEARGWSATIREVVEQDRMPPWGADPRYGRFLNERRLSDLERRQLLDWCTSGAAEGPATNPLVGADIRPATKPAAGPLDAAATTASSGPPSSGTIGPPDCLIELPTTQQIPAEGLIEYRSVTVDPHFAQDRWISAVEIYPGNRKVLHHCTVFLSPPGAEGTLAEQGTLGSFCFATYTPGTAPAIFPAGMAKLMPAGWRFVFVLHYVTNGVPATDRTSMGLKFADPQAVRKEVATKLLFDNELSLAPGERDHVVERTWPVEKDVLLLSIFPHMHLRGRSFQYDAVYADGHVETLLSVPKYDFNWQHRYILAEPKRLPAGTILRATAHYDNSAGNPNNPDPKATVRAGKLTTDEMFNAYFDFALASEDRLASHSGCSWASLLLISFAAGILSFCILLGRMGRRQIQVEADVPAAASRT